MPFDATGLAKVTGTLVDDGASEEDVMKVMGGNQIRFLLENLPD